MKTFAKPVAILLGALFAAITLTGCVSLTVEEAKESPHRVIETKRDFWEGRSWSYEGPGEKVVPLSVKCSDFWTRCAKSEDGVIEFYWSQSKHGAVIGQKLVMDGAEWKIECTVVEAWSSEYICAPKQETENDE